MPLYDYRCGVCEAVETHFHSMDGPDTEILHCKEPMVKVFLSAPGTVVPPQHSANPDKLKYYGIKDIRTGEGITKDTDVRDKPGMRVRGRTVSHKDKGK